jgi:hypothetical protein
MKRNDHELLLSNLQHHLNEDQIPVKKIGLAIFYYFHLLDNPKLQKLVTKETQQTLMSYMFKNMREVPMNDLAVCLQFLDLLDISRSQMFIAKLQDLISVTNPKLLIFPTSMALI